MSDQQKKQPPQGCAHSFGCPFYKRRERDMRFLRKIQVQDVPFSATQKLVRVSSSLPVQRVRIVPKMQEAGDFVDWEFRRRQFLELTRNKLSQSLDRALELSESMSASEVVFDLKSSGSLDCATLPATQVADKPIASALGEAARESRQRYEAFRVANARKRAHEKADAEIARSDLQLGAAANTAVLVGMRRTGGADDEWARYEVVSNKQVFTSNIKHRNRPRPRKPAPKFCLPDPSDRKLLNAAVDTSPAWKRPLISKQKTPEPEEDHASAKINIGDGTFHQNTIGFAEAEARRQEAERIKKCVDKIMATPLPMDEWRSLAAYSRLSTLDTDSIRQEIVHKLEQTQVFKEQEQNLEFLFQSTFEKMIKEGRRMLTVKGRPELIVGNVVQQSVLLKHNDQNNDNSD